MTISTEMYAKALYEINETKPLIYLEELKAFAEILSADKDVEKYFSKTYNQFDQVRDILGERFSEIFINFLEIIYENRVFGELDNVIVNYERLLFENDHITSVDVVSAKQLSDDNKESILKMVRSKYKKPLQVKYSINEDLMAGYIVKVNNDIYDTSLKNKLDQIKNLEV